MNFGPMEIGLILLAILLLFGYKKLAGCVALPGPFAADLQGGDEGYEGRRHPHPGCRRCNSGPR